MDDRDELDQLWRGQPSGLREKGEDMLTIVMQKTKQFDRRVLVRNVMECIAAAMVASAFTIAALHAPNALMRGGPP